MITFETKIWENDWKYILEGDYLNQMISRCNVSFAKKILFINNVKDRKKVEDAVKEKINDGTIDDYYFVEDYSDIALKFFGLDKNSFNGGYYYSISELVSIYLCKSDYLLHFSGDSYLARNSFKWIKEAISIMENRNDILVANPSWNNKFDEAKHESLDEIEDFYIGYGFSDQCYLIKTNSFEKQIYNEKNIASERYPTYGGDLFEKKVDSYMRNHNLKRITSKTSSYISKNFSKNWMLQNLPFFRNYYVQKRMKNH